MDSVTDSPVMMPIEEMLQLFEDEVNDGSPIDENTCVFENNEFSAPLLEEEIDPHDIQEVLRVINSDVLDIPQTVEDPTSVKRRKRRSTELERLARYGWERVEDKATNKRVKYSYVSRSGQTCTSLKEAMTYCREVDASAA